MLYTDRRKRWSRQRRFLRLLAACTVIFCAAGLGTRFAPEFSRQARKLIARNEPSPATRASLPKGSRPVYPYSIIRGGAYSAAELNGALDTDPVAARHYRVFDRARVHTVAAAFTDPVYLSYRIGQAIYWTSRPVHLPRGETLLSDGRNYARARCGNRISEKPQEPMSESEPAPSTLDEAKPPAGLRVADTDRWTEDRLLPPTTLPLGQLAMGTSPAIIAGPGLPPEAITPPAWWSVTPPTGFLPVPGIEPNPLAEFPVNPPTTSPILVPWIPPTVPGIPLIPSSSGTSVPEPILWVPIALALAGGALAKLRRKP